MTKVCPPDRPVLLHVGLHKTGSTWLQSMVFTNEGYGFASPWGEMAGLAAEEFLLTDPLGFDAERTWEKFRPGCEGGWERGLVPVVSHEALSSRPLQGSYYTPYVADRLHSVFPGARVVIGVREQRSMLLSLFRQHIRTGGREDLRSFIGTGDEPPGWAPLCSLDFLRYDRFVSCYRERFGEDRVLVLPIELLAADRPGYVGRLSRFAGVPEIDDTQIGGRSNVGWGGLTLAVRRRMNRVLLRNRLSRAEPWSVRQATRLCYHLDRVAPKSWNRRIESRWRREIADRVGTYFEESNARLSELLGEDLAALGYPVAGR